MKTKACVWDSACTEKRRNCKQTTACSQTRWKFTAITRRKHFLKDGCQAEGLTVTSACDLGVSCRLGLFAMTAKGWHSSQQAHVCSRLIMSITSLYTDQLSHDPPRVLRAGRRVSKWTRCSSNWTIYSGVRKHHPTAASRSVATHILSPSA